MLKLKISDYGSLKLDAIILTVLSLIIFSKLPFYQIFIRMGDQVSFSYGKNHNTNSSGSSELIIPINSSTEKIA